MTLENLMKTNLRYGKKLEYFQRMTLRLIIIYLTRPYDCGGFNQNFGHVIHKKVEDYDIKKVISVYFHVPIDLVRQF